jgi:threonine dehydrogenase-like Zn-dependent dehydrogenase
MNPIEGIPMTVSAIRGSPLHWIAANNARFPALAAIRDVVGVVVGKRAVVALAVVDDVVVVAVGGPFNDECVRNCVRPREVIPTKI